MQGYRTTMEDTFLADVNSLGNNIHIFSIFDGHGGREVAIYLRDNFTKFLKMNKHFKREEYELALIQVFKQID
jgi:serine/threonine protein phosphatase PrpC